MGQLCKTLQCHTGAQIHDSEAPTLQSKLQWRDTCVAKETPKSHPVGSITKVKDTLRAQSRTSQLYRETHSLTVPFTEERRRIFLQTVQKLLNISAIFLYVAWKRSHYSNRYVCLNNTANHGLLPCLRAQRHPFPPLHAVPCVT